MYSRHIKQAIIRGGICCGGDITCQYFEGKKNINPYIIPNNLSINKPNICLSRSELSTFLILLSMNNEIKNIIGIEIIILIKLLII